MRVKKVQDHGFQENYKAIEKGQYMGADEVGPKCKIIISSNT